MMYTFKHKEINLKIVLTSEDAIHAQIELAQIVKNVHDFEMVLAEPETVQNEPLSY